MSSIEYQVNKIDGKKQSGLIANIAKQLVLKVLGRIRVGHITLDDGEEHYEFGDSSSKTEFGIHIHVHDSNAYKQVMLSGTIGVGEAYIAGWWSTNDLAKLIKIFVANQATMRNMDTPLAKVGKSLHSVWQKFRPNTLNGAKKNILAHYDLNNDFFALFLDPTMMYSAAIYPTKTTTLDEASIYKLNHICERLALTDQDHLLEIGTGWGGLALFAAKRYGCRVTTTTISDEQYEYTCKQVKLQGLEEKITVLKKDYRLLEGKFDKLVSVEMIEAVGHKYYREYFNCCSRLLKENGKMLIQAITTLDQRFPKEKDKIDFIRRYIFPGGCLPSHAEILNCTAEVTNLHLIGLEDITLDYARTLADWRMRFYENIDSVKAMGFSDKFIRMWDFYLCYCEGGFYQRVIGTSQLLFAKPSCRDLPGI